MGIYTFDNLDWEALEEAMENSEDIQKNRIDDMVEMIEDHCLAVCLDEGRNHTVIPNARRWAHLNDQHWEELILQLRQLKILGAQVRVNERKAKASQEIELYIHWGFLN